MTSEIKVDTISEQTSANGVAIDSVTLKDGGIAATAASTITTSDNTTQLTLKSTDADAAVGPVLTLHRESSSPADDDIIGRINFIGEDSGGTDTTYGRIETVIMQESNGSEDATMEFRIMKGGTERNILELDRSAVIINEDSQDIDFRVESNGVDKMLFVNGGTNTVSIGGEATPLGRLHVFTADSSASAHANADELVIEGSAYSGMTIASGNSSHGTIAFADSGDELAGRIIYNHSTNAMSFGTSGTGTQWSINSDGNLLPGSSTGQGIHLGVTSAGAANLLDDYEEGTYAPVFTVASGSLTPHGSHNALAYTKIGRVVHVQGEVRFSAVSSPSGNFNVSLPFAVADLTDGAARSTSGAIGQSGFGGTPDATYYLRITSEGTTTAFFATHNSGSDTGVNANQVSTSTEMILSFTFIAA